MPHRLHPDETLGSQLSDATLAVSSLIVSSTSPSRFISSFRTVRPFDSLAGNHNSAAATLFSWDKALRASA
jgi:hypothetical protein